MIITKVTPARWQQAQEWEREISKRIAAKGDDYNMWWAVRFDGYKVLKGLHFENVLEVGCGPCTNSRLILPLIKHINLYLEDPLLAQYITASNPVAALPARHLLLPLEHLILDDASVNLVICINVLDHVQDAEKCMERMTRVLAPGGILIIGQDLSNAEDYKLCPSSWTDVGHPIKLDRAFFDDRLTGFTPLYDVTLTREQGRNPKCHYGTMLWIGAKHG